MGIPSMLDSLDLIKLGILAPAIAAILWLLMQKEFFGAKSLSIGDVGFLAPARYPLIYVTWHLIYPFVLVALEVHVVNTMIHQDNPREWEGVVAGQKVRLKYAIRSQVQRDRANARKAIYALGDYKRAYDSENARHDYMRVMVAEALTGAAQRVGHWSEIDVSELARQLTHEPVRGTLERVGTVICEINLFDFAPSEAQVIADALDAPLTQLHS